MWTCTDPQRGQLPGFGCLHADQCGPGLIVRDLLALQYSFRITALCMMPSDPLPRDLSIPADRRSRVPGSRICARMASGSAREDLFCDRFRYRRSLYLSRLFTSHLTSKLTSIYFKTGRFLVVIALQTTTNDSMNQGTKNPIK